MQFDKDDLATQLAHSHPRIISVADALDTWLMKQGWPQACITHAWRTPEQQEEFYWQTVQNTLKCTEEIARKTARTKPSWHLWRCAVDIRNKTYTPVQRQDILKFLQDGRKDSLWEILLHDVGRGDHFHIGYRDYGWRKQYSTQSVA